MNCPFYLFVIFLLQTNFVDRMESGTPSVTRRELIHEGSNAASMLHTVTQGVPESIFVALGMDC
jgi:hypothetical protein